MHEQLFLFYSNLQGLLLKNTNLLSSEDKKYLERVTILRQIFRTLNELLSSNKFDEAHHIVGRLTANNSTTDIDIELIKTLYEDIKNAEENPRIILQKEVFNLSEYSSNKYKSKLESIRNCFEQFGEIFHVYYPSRIMDRLQVDVINYDEFTITNIFNDLKLICVEQINCDSVSLKLNLQLFNEFEKELKSKRVNYD